MSRLVFSILLILASLRAVYSRFEFTNLKCDPVDPSFLKFEICDIKARNRTYKYLSIKVHLLKKPVDNVRVSGILYKKTSIYRPFLYNFTVDGCKFLRSMNRNLFAKYFYDSFKAYTNLNHSCPYDHDVIVDKLDTSHLDQYMKILLLPQGKYLMDTNWAVYNVIATNIKIYFEM